MLKGIFLLNIQLMPIVKYNKWHLCQLNEYGNKYLTTKNKTNLSMNYLSWNVFVKFGRGIQIKLYLSLCF